MNVPREQILEALLNLLSTTQYNGAPAFVTISRKFQMWDAVPEGAQPACFLRQLPGRVDQTDPFGLNRWTLRCGIWIYAKYSPDSETIPGVVLNYLVDAVERVLLPSPAFPMQTLGGLVVNCWLNGETPLDEGYFPGDNQALIMLPVSILTGV